MNQATIQAIAAGHRRDMQEHSAAWRRAGEGRRPGVARRPWPLMRIPLASRGPRFLSAS
jgi:hypothetical protein